LPLIAGYWFVHFCYYFHFRSQRLDGYRLLIESAIAGTFLLFLGRLITFGVSATAFGHWFRPIWASFAPVDFSGTGAATLALGMAAPIAVNRWLVTKEDARARAIGKHGNNFLRLTFNAQVRERTISVTLDNRKTYIGYMVDAPSLDPNDSYVRLLPLLSGYRDKDTLELKFTTTYSDFYGDDAEPLDFTVAFPIAQVRMASFFDERVKDDVIIEKVVPEEVVNGKDAALPHAG